MTSRMRSRLSFTAGAAVGSSTTPAGVGRRAMLSLTLLSLGIGGLMPGCSTTENTSSVLNPDRAAEAKGLCGHSLWPDAPTMEGDLHARHDDRVAIIREEAERHGIRNALAIVGLASQLGGGLEHCWSEAKWNCQGPASADCGGGPVIAQAQGDVCPDDAELGLFALSASSTLEGDRDVLSFRGNVAAGIERILDLLWRDREHTPTWNERDEMIQWLDRVIPGSDEYETWLDAMTALYRPCKGDGCPEPAYLRDSYDLATRDLVLSLGTDFWTLDESGAEPAARAFEAASSCSCAQGIYHNGTPIPASSTYCGERVCGMNNTVFECTTGGWSAIEGISCDLGGCSCGGGTDYRGTPIAAANTECHFRACGLDQQFYTCTTEGWKGTEQSCPEDDPRDASCQCAGGVDQNGEAIATSDTYCGFETCGVENRHWVCSPSGWKKVSDTCVSAPSGSATFGYPLGDKTTGPGGGGGWSVWQVMGHYWSNYGGRHLAQDVGKSSGAYESVYSIGDGVVRVSAPNSSTYRNVVLIEHDMGDGSKVCSFYAHLDRRTVSAGQIVRRGDPIATVMNQGGNTHLHYVVMNERACDEVANRGGALCGYDGGGPGNGVGHSDLANEPYQYTAIGTNPYNYCNISSHDFISPSKFIDDHHFAR